jgi:hypothetical protein
MIRCIRARAKTEANRFHTLSSRFTTRGLRIYLKDSANDQELYFYTFTRFPHCVATYQEHPLVLDSLATPVKHLAWDRRVHLKETEIQA